MLSSKPANRIKTNSVQVKQARRLSKLKFTQTNARTTEKDKHTILLTYFSSEMLKTDITLSVKRNTRVMNKHVASYLALLSFTERDSSI